MKAATILALTMSLGATNSLASPSKEEHVGDLICTVAKQSPKAAMICIFRNNNTGLEETYTGSVANAGGASSVSPQRTLLWAVNVNSRISLTPGVLAQRYEPPESEQKKPKSIEGDDKPGVTLSLITDRNDDLAALATLTMELKLISAPT
jgi:hypothetical protein